jgi:hypothetical protein
MGAKQPGRAHAEAQRRTAQDAGTGAWARADAPTGGRIVQKRGAARDLQFWGHSDRSRPARPSVASTKTKRKCVLCGRPILFLAAPVLLVAIFGLRSQRSQQTPPSSGYLAGYQITLDAFASAREVNVVVTVQPAGRLLGLLLRTRPAAAGTPVTAAIYLGSHAASAEYVFGQAPNSAGGTTELETLLRPPAGVSLGTAPVVSAQVSMAGRSLSLSRTASRN